MIYIKNTAAFIGAFLLGNVANMGIILLGSNLIPAPQGVDVADMESIKANFHLFEPKHFIIPFFAHAFGTLVAAYLVSRLVATKSIKWSMAMGILFLIAGIVNVMMLPTPLWFSMVDIVLAYIPMAYLGWKIANL